MVIAASLAFCITPILAPDVVDYQEQQSTDEVDESADVVDLPLDEPEDLSIGPIGQVGMGEQPEDRQETEWSEETEEPTDADQSDVDEDEEPIESEVSIQAQKEIVPSADIFHHTFVDKDVERLYCNSIRELARRAASLRRKSGTWGDKRGKKSKNRSNGGGARRDMSDGGRVVGHTIPCYDYRKPAGYIRSAQYTGYAGPLWKRSYSRYAWLGFVAEYLAFPWFKRMFESWPGDQDPDRIKQIEKSRNVKEWQARNISRKQLKHIEQVFHSVPSYTVNPLWLVGSGSVLLGRTWHVLSYKERAPRPEQFKFSYTGSARWPLEEQTEENYKSIPIRLPLEQQGWVEKLYRVHYRSQRAKVSTEYHADVTVWVHPTLSDEISSEALGQTTVWERPVPNPRASSEARALANFETQSELRLVQPPQDDVLDEYLKLRDTLQAAGMRNPVLGTWWTGDRCLDSRSGHPLPERQQRIRFPSREALPNRAPNAESGRVITKLVELDTETVKAEASQVRGRYLVTYADDDARLGVASTIIPKAGNCRKAAAKFIAEHPGCTVLHVMKVRVPEDKDNPPTPFIWYDPPSGRVLHDSDCGLTGSQQRKIQDRAQFDAVLSWVRARVVGIYGRRPKYKSPEERERRPLLQQFASPDLFTVLIVPLRIERRLEKLDGSRPMYFAHSLFEKPLWTSTGQLEGDDFPRATWQSDDKGPVNVRRSAVYEDQPETLRCARCGYERGATAKGAHCGEPWQHVRKRPRVKLARVATRSILGRWISDTLHLVHERWTSELHFVVETALTNLNAVKDAFMKLRNKEEPNG